MDKPNTIAVNVEVEREVHASWVRMHVEIRGASFYSGNAALKKAEEVRHLVLALEKLGLEEKRIQVLAIRAGVSSGIIGKSSSAVYALRIDLPTLDLLADTLGAVTSQKNVAVTTLEWQYGDLEPVHQELLREALRQAESRATLICATLGHRNLGVHSLTEKLRGAERGSVAVGGALFGAQSRGRALHKEDLGLTVSHSKTICLETRIEYLVEREAAASR